MHVADHWLELACARAAGVEWWWNPAERGPPPGLGRECGAGEHAGVGPWWMRSVCTVGKLGMLLTPGGIGLFSFLEATFPPSYPHPR